MRWLDLRNLERQGEAVEAVAFAGGRGTIIENMTEVAAAAAAVDFGAGGKPAFILLGANRAGYSVPEAGPAGFTVVFGF